MRSRTRFVVGVIIAAALFVALPLITWLATVWTDYLWYADLGQKAVFVTRIVSQLAVGGIFGLAAFLILFGSMRIARKMAPKVFAVGLPEQVPEQLALVIETLRTRIGPILDWAILIVSLWFAFVNGATMAAQWTTFRLAVQGGRFGIADPQFGRDVGFFVFSLPALEVVASWLTGILVLTIFLTLLVHLISGAIQPWARDRMFAPHVKAHLSVLLAALVLSRAYVYWLDIWNLSFSPRGQVTGASYTDVHAQLPAYWILIVISIGTAILLLMNIRYRGWRLPIFAVGAWIAAAILIGGIFPALMQQFVVTPNEQALETPYIERNIKMTRLAFGLAQVEGKPFPAGTGLTGADVAANKDTLQNVRLWDPTVAKQDFRQLQAVRQYYDFADVDVDRYKIGGTERQVLVSARELNVNSLDPKAQNWVNTHLVYTHGFGLVMTPVNEADSRGLPQFVVGDIPPTVSSSLATGPASAALQITQPRIYFGEDTDPYVLVNTRKSEFDYPKGEANAYNQYSVDAGPKVGSIVQRIAWAIRLSSSQLLFSAYVKPDSRVLMTRDITARVNKLAPWLTLEDDPYPVLLDGKILWVIDGYTHSSRFPYSERIASGANYLRNSVKVTIDAYTGKTTIYAFEPNEPILKAWASIFPTLITSADKIPAGLSAHFRYPQGLFSAQAEAYRTYHMTNVSVFYNKEDQWWIPGERKGEPMEPFFVLLRLPGQPKEHFYLMQPYTPRNRDNMIGWMAASCDPDNYGQRTVYLFPKDRVILGPEQVAARIQQDPVISPQLTLWSQRGSHVLYGNMLVIPMKDSIVYIQSLFLEAEGQTALPELTRVIVAYADKVAMDKTLEGALLSVFGEAPAAVTTGTPSPGALPANIGEARKLYDQAIAAQKRGDWAGYGRAITELGRLLDELQSKTATSGAGQ